MNEEFFANVPCAMCGRSVRTKYISSRDVEIRNYCEDCGPIAYREATGGAKAKKPGAPLRAGRRGKDDGK